MSKARPWVVAIGAATCICLCLAIGLAWADEPSWGTPASRDMAGDQVSPQVKNLPAIKNVPAAAQERSTGGRASALSVLLLPPPSDIDILGIPETLPPGAQLVPFGEQVGTPRAGAQVYFNDGITGYIGPSVSDPDSAAIGDDLVLAGTDRALYSFNIAVSCTLGAAYNVTAQFYAYDAGCVGLPITGATWTWTAVPVDNDNHLLESGVFPQPPSPVITLPRVCYLGLTFTNPNAGWATTGVAEIGMTSQFYPLKSTGGVWTCNHEFATGYAGFYVDVYCTGGYGVCCTGTTCATHVHQIDCEAGGGYYFPGRTSCDPTPCCQLTDPVPCTSAAEACVTGTNTNGGCDPNNPGIFTSIVCNTSVCATYWATDTVRDSDWYQITIAQPTMFKFSVDGELPTIAGLIKYITNPGSGNCVDVIDTNGDIGISPYSVADACQTGSIRTACLDPGIYWFIVEPADLQNWPCKTGPPVHFKYTATLTCLNPCPLVDEFDSRHPTAAGVEMTVAMEPSYGGGTKILSLQSVCRDDLGRIYRDPPPYSSGDPISLDLAFFAVRGTDTDLGAIILTESYTNESGGAVTNVAMSGSTFQSGDAALGVYVDLDLPEYSSGLTFTGVGPFPVAAHITALPPYGTPFTWTGTSGCMGNTYQDLVGPPPEDPNTVNGLDIQGFVSCALGLGAGYNCARADMDCNSTVNAADITLFVAALMSGTCGSPCQAGVALIPDLPAAQEPIGYVTAVSHRIAQNNCATAIYDNGRANGTRNFNAQRDVDGSLDRWVVDDINVTPDPINQHLLITAIHWCTNLDDDFIWSGKVDVGFWLASGVGNAAPMTTPAYQLLDVTATRDGVLPNMCYTVVLPSEIVLPKSTRSWFVGVRPVGALTSTGQAWWYSTADQTGQAVWYNNLAATPALGWQSSFNLFGGSYDVNFCIEGSHVNFTNVGSCCYWTGTAPIVTHCDPADVVSCYEGQPNANYLGDFRPDQTVCDDGACLGACCYDAYTDPLNNRYRTCDDTEMQNCNGITYPDANAEFQGPGTKCIDVPYPCEPILGGCCYGNAACQWCEDLTAVDCEAKGTAYISWNEASLCAAVPCAYNSCGACCTNLTDCAATINDDCSPYPIGMWNRYRTCDEAKCGKVCGLDCTGYQESEMCGADPDLNIGCNDTITPLFETITVPTTICGSTRNYIPAGTTVMRRDTDWYKFTLTSGSLAYSLTASVRAACPMQLLLIRNDGGDCDSYAIVADVNSTGSTCLPNPPAVMTYNCVTPTPPLPAQVSWYLWVGVGYLGTDQDAYPYPCTNYKVDIALGLADCPLAACCTSGQVCTEDSEWHCKLTTGNSWYVGHHCADPFTCPSCGTLSKKQSTNATAVGSNAMACVATDADDNQIYTLENSYCRSYTATELGTGLARINWVRCVDFGVQGNNAGYGHEATAGDWPVDIILYRDENGGSPTTDDFTELGRTSYMVPINTAQKMFTAYFLTPVNISSVINPATLVVELHAANRDPDVPGGDGGMLWMGFNNRGETPIHSSYLMSFDCGIPEWASFWNLWGVASYNLIQVIRGSNTGP